MDLLSYWNEIKEAGPEKTISSPLSLKLLKLYSILYLGGKAPKTCAKAQRQYYQQLITDGEMKAKNYKERTCVPNWKGLMYSPKMGGHLSPEYITDEQANHALAIGALTEKNFTKLPEDHDEYMVAFEAEKAEEEAKKVEALEKTNEIDLINDVELEKGVILAVVEKQGNLSKLSTDLIDYIIDLLGVELTEEENTKSEKIAKIEQLISEPESGDEEEIIIE